MPARPPTVLLISSQLPIRARTTGSRVYHPHAPFHSEEGSWRTLEKGKLLNKAVRGTFETSVKWFNPQREKKHPCPLPSPLQPMITFLPSCCPIATLSSSLTFCKPLLWTSPRWAGGNVQGKGLHETQFPAWSRCVLRALRLSHSRRAWTGLEGGERAPSSNTGCWPVLRRFAPYHWMLITACWMRSFSGYMLERCTAWPSPYVFKRSKLQTSSKFTASHERRQDLIKIWLPGCLFGLRHKN